MDCEKAETLLIDELYDELDEVTSAAVRRHVGTCARCHDKLADLRRTRRLVTPVIVEPPADLELRILKAVDASEPVAAVIPFRKRVGRAISYASALAMRPQTAVAAVFLVVIGSSFVLMRGRYGASRVSATDTIVTEQGAPVASSALAEAPERGRPSEPVYGSGAAPIAASGLARATHVDGESRGAPPSLALGPTVAAPMGAPPQMAAPGRVMAESEAADTRSPMKSRTAETSGTAGSPEFRAAMKLFDQQRFDDAMRAFDKLSGDDVSALLWAARAANRGSGRCSAAVARYDGASTRAAGTPIGWDALLEGGRCYRALGNFEAARSRLQKLLTVEGWSVRAQAELDAMTAPVGSSGAAGGGRATPRAAPTAASPQILQRAPSRATGPESP